MFRKLALNFLLLSTIVISLFAKSNLNPHSYLPKENIEELVVSKLDLSSFRNSFGPIRKPGMIHFKDFGERPTKISKNCIIFDSKDWYYQIDIVDIKDVNGDGLEDILIDFYDKSKEGSYNTVQRLLLSRYSKQGNLIAVRYDVDNK
ncbi:MAG: hypothetical protein K9L76_00215 [Candidatus Omnitrophica bacterium]|nr:hypothetical protein [Candidatus Omnitrophota bacterium]